MIQGKDICKSFDGFTALDHTTFHVKKGSVYGLVGPNGAGKSTLIRHIMGIYKQDEGSLLVDGQEIFENIAVKSRMAFIPDELFYFSRSNLLDMKKYYKGIYPDFDEELFEKIKECFPECNEKKQIKHMSKGMQKQAIFMLSICLKPDVLILDEPVDGLDPVMRRQVWSLLLDQVSEREMTVLVSSHNLRELEDVCDYVGIMNRGKIMLEQSLEDVQSNIAKIQVAFGENQEMPELPEECTVLKEEVTGRLHTLIIKGEHDLVERALKQGEPVLLEFLPLSLEEVFIYELGGEDYAVKDIIL